jgi:hypothetical protein
MSSPTGQAARDASAGSSAPPPAAAPRLVPGRASSVRAFLALCERDLWVTVRHEPFAFLSQALLQPLFFLFVFGRVLPEIGAVEGDYAVQLLPGIVALTLILTALQNTALPLVIEFSFTREIEDRLLAPLPVTWVALEKMLIAAVRGLVAGALIFPLGELILPGGISAGSGTLWLLIIVARARDRGPAEPHQRHVCGRAHPADLHRRHLLSVGGARKPALVPGHHPLQPDDLRERGHADRAHLNPPHADRVDHRGDGGGAGAVRRARAAWIRAAGGGLGGLRSRAGWSAGTLRVDHDHV